MHKIALITGATSGIGEATAHILAENGFNLILTGRRNDRLLALKSQLESTGNAEVLTLCFDVRNKEEAAQAVNGLPDSWKSIDVLVNNAGLAAGLSPIDQGDIDDWEQMIDTNIKGLLYMTRAVSPLMVTAKKGHIINIGSIAGKEVYPNGNVYCATKHAVDALSRATRIDLLHAGIRVTNIAPGLAETEFSMVRFKGDEEKAKKVYEGLTPLYAQDIAEAILFAITRPPHVTINDMVIMATDQASATAVRRGGS